ncbi:MAG: hypothetical protein A2077_02865 [Nitrospirae bacterium GWC2_46_6]|nr:MAG: hypothetical protein A2077_02865 [Nitrospirae bacterium GWC2_46_6]OGW21696.1 MAG: hypothetical protein A2Z82_03595 [Nitrospirae bacterium GWA2_46_11]OGW23631.1 MAG: hypothetical protein A2X55_03350 [Nitrospirae bacterium GWB2_47_37]HAK88126.1 hypothetical protein [Nitrospiraceae bacterium]HCL82219.1 hypothetical protein [Nitrospiraceae bacterium]
MKIKFLVPLVSILLLLMGGVLAIAGLTQKSWPYLLFSLTHSTAGGILWFIYKDMGKKIEEAKKESERR